MTLTRPTVGAGALSDEPVAQDIEVTWVEVGAADRTEVRVPTLELGDASGPPVVLVPGLTDGLHPVSRPHAWGQYTRLPVPMERCRGLVVSHRHPMEASVTTRQLAADLAQVVESAGMAPAVLICHSMGTMIALHLAAERADLVAGMVLSAPLVAVDADLREVIGRWADLAEQRRWSDLAQDALECSYTGSELEQRRTLAAVLPPEPADEQLRARHLALSAACLRHEPPANLAQIAAPTLLLAGEHDRVAPPRHARQLSRELSAARLHVLPGLAHGFPEQAPTAFASLVTSFLGDVAGVADWG